MEEKPKSVVEVSSVRGRVSSASAWGFIVERAQLEVCKHLATTTVPFDGTTPMASSMMTLLDHHALKEIMVERNFHQLCGCIGCNKEPVGIQAILETGATDIPEWSQSDPDEDEEEEALLREGEENITYNVDEIVYDDDIFTEQSFRLAQTQLKQLHRIQTRREKEEKLEEGRKIKYVPVGIPKEERFCSIECLNTFEEEIQAAVLPHLDVSDPRLLPSISYLFPNLRSEVLQVFAAAEKDSAASVLKGEVTERNPSENVPPVRTDVNYEVEQPPPPTDRPSESSTNSKHDPTSPSLRALLNSMKALTEVWSSEAAPHTALYRENAGRGDIAKTDAVPAVSLAPQRQETPPHRPALKGIYFAIHFLQQLSGPRSRNLMLLHYVSQRNKILELFSSSRETNATCDYKRLITPIINSLEKKCSELDFLQEGELTPSESWSDPLLRLAGEEDTAPRSSQREVRLQLFTSTVLGPLSADYLGSLLVTDPYTVSGLAWGEVWLGTPLAILRASTEVQRAWRAEAPLTSLPFLFTIPGNVLQPASLSVEALLIGLLFFLAAGIVSGSKSLWEVLTSDALQELIEVLQLSPADIFAGIQILLFDEEDV